MVVCELTELYKSVIYFDFINMNRKVIDIAQNDISYTSVC